MNRSAVIPQKFDGSVAQPAKPLESFAIDRDPLTGWEIEPAPQPQFRKCIPVYDAMTGELREFLL